MKKHLKQLSCLALALVMALCALPALAGEAHGPLWIEGAEGKTLTYWIPIDSQAAQYFETYAEHPFFQWMEEQTGVDDLGVYLSYVASLFRDDNRTAVGERDESPVECRGRFS